MLRKYTFSKYGECAHEQHVRRTLTLTLTHTITAYSVSGNVVRVHILICATRQKPCTKTVYRSVPNTETS